SGLRKDNTGYDLRDLLIGSEGTLAIITAATLKLQPRPAAVATAMASLRTLGAATSLLALAHERLGPGLTGFEVMNTLSLDLVRPPCSPVRTPLPAAAWTVLVEHSDVEDQAHATATLESLLGTAMERGLVHDAPFARRLQQANTMQQRRTA